MVELCPAQEKAYVNAKEALTKGNIVVVWSNHGMGRSTILRQLHSERGGDFLNMKDYIDELRVTDPLSMEETLEHMLMRALHRNDFVIVDDLHLIYAVICGCYGTAYPRSKFVEAIFTSLTAFVTSGKKQIILGMGDSVPESIRSRCYWGSIHKFSASDYRSLCETFLEEPGKNLDYQKIFRFAPKLNAHQLKMACLWLKDSENLDTERFIEYMRSQRMGSNVDLEEVEAVDITSLRGVDDVISSLEANIIVPLERDDLALKYDIQPKRGVLLAGPPGTGKTTIGRALAHRLRSKFFLIDGTYISGTRDFYDRIRHVFEAAKNNAPAIIFIDDSDVIFENKEDFGLYRYLLTMLDGLESESNKRVSIMMTTMDVSSVPPALVRSGRIELWLETRTPNEAARLAILRDHTHKLPEELRSFDAERLATETEGLTGADLKRLIEDAKILLAYDRSRDVKVEDVYSYFEQSTETIRSNKEKYEQAEATARHRAPSLREAMEAAFGGYRGRGENDDDGPP
jgi:transitional endoplasmic reticulum ATPase